MSAPSSHHFSSVSPRHYGWLPTPPHLSHQSSHSCGLWVSCCLWSSQTVLPMPHTLPHVNRQLVGSCCINRNSTQYSVTTQSGGMGTCCGREVKTEGTHAYLWLIHVVWQKPTKHSKAIIFQFKKILFSTHQNDFKISGLTHSLKHII